MDELKTPPPVAKKRPLDPGRLLFPVASAFAALAIPLGLATHAAPVWHAHEMLFGYALAVVAGFLVTRPGRATSWILLGTWMIGRALPFTSGGGLLAFTAALAFPAAVLVAAIPPLLRGAKRWENRIVPAVLVILFTADATWWAGRLWLGAAVQQRALLVTVDLFALLLLILGGRVLPAAVGGYLERRNIPRRDHVRRGYELPLAAIMGAACALDAAGLAGGAGALCATAGLVTLARLVPWQLQRTGGRPELWALSLGYLWLIPGLLLKACAQIFDNPPLNHTLHGITVGAIGTITLVMMARTATLRARLPFEGFADAGAAAVLISIAALCRLAAAPALSWRAPLLWLAAAAWSTAFVLILVRLLRTRKRGK